MFFRRIVQSSYSLKAKMNSLISLLTILTVIQVGYGGPLRLQKRAAFYIANETACVVDSIVYSNGDPIPTDDPCETCKCRPPGFACVLKDCQPKPGCRAIRRVGNCCPDYICETKNDSFEPETPILNDKEENSDSVLDGGEAIVPGVTFNSDIIPGVTYVEDTTQPPEDDTDMIEVLIPEITKLEESLEETQPEDPEVVNVYAAEPTDLIKIEDSSNVEPEVIEVQPITFIAPEQEIPSELIVGKDTETIVILKHEENSAETVEEQEIPEIPEEISTVIADSETKPENPEAAHSFEDISSEHTSESHSIEHSSEHISEEHSTEYPADHSSEEHSVEHSSEVSLTPEDTHHPLPIENVDVEHEEPSNNLEAENIPSDYGKSLRFPEENEPLNNTEMETIETTHSKADSTKEIEISTESLALSKIETPESTSTKVPVTEKIYSEPSEKNLYYNQKENLQTGSTETVTTISIVEEHTELSIHNKTEDVSSVPPPIEHLFKSLSDKLKADIAEKVIVTPESIITSINPETKETTTKLDETTIKVDETRTKISEKIISTDNVATAPTSEHDVQETTTVLQ